MRIVKIEPAGIDDVFNMEVADTHDFAIETGVIAHNCYDEFRYVCMARPITPREKVTEQPWSPPPDDPLNQRTSEAEDIDDPYEYIKLFG